MKQYPEFVLKQDGAPIDPLLIQYLIIPGAVRSKCIKPKSTDLRPQHR